MKNEMKCDLCNEAADTTREIIVCEGCGVAGCNSDECFGDTSGNWDCPECGYMNGDD